MKKYAVPLILLSVVLVAGIFALTPVYQASTVHTTITAGIDDQNRAMTWTIEDGIATHIVVPVGNLITGTAILSTIDGGGTCELRTGAGVNDDGPIDDLVLGDTEVATLTGQDGVAIAIEGSTATCTLTIFIESAAG